MSRVDGAPGRDPVAGGPPPADRPPAPLLPRAPWSVIGPDFVRAWGYPGGKFHPEHVEILGPSGSGKTYFEAKILQQRAAARGSNIIFIATKPADETIMRLGWPIVGDWRALIRSREKQVVFWPRSDKVGTEHEAFMERRIRELLDRLWKAKAKVVLVFDEVATAEDLSRDLRIRIKRFWREARSVGITLVAMKQRPQGVQRDMHSETTWVAAFRPKDEDDALRVAEVMGGKRLWVPRLMSLDRDRHEFVLLNVRTGRAIVTWVDVPLKPAVPERRGLYQARRAR